MDLVGFGERKDEEDDEKFSDVMFKKFREYKLQISDDKTISTVLHVEQTKVTSFSPEISSLKLTKYWRILLNIQETILLCTILHYRG